MITNRKAKFHKQKYAHKNLKCNNTLCNFGTVVAKISYYNGGFYLRVSCNAYNTIEDFEKLANLVEKNLLEL